MVQKNSTPKKKNNNSNFFLSTTSKTKSYKEDDDFKEFEKSKYIKEEKNTLENCSKNIELFQKVEFFLFYNYDDKNI